MGDCAKGQSLIFWVKFTKKLFTKPDLDADGNLLQYVRTTSEVSITIVPISAWTTVTSDGALNAVEQKLLEAEAKIKALEEIAFNFDSTKADNIAIDTACVFGGFLSALIIEDNEVVKYYQVEKQIDEEQKYAD